MDDRKLEAVTGGSGAVPDSKYELGQAVWYRDDSGKKQEGVIGDAYWETVRGSWFYLIPTGFGLDVVREKDIIGRMD